MLVEVLLLESCDSCVRQDCELNKAVYSVFRQSLREEKSDFVVSLSDSLFDSSFAWIGSCML